MPGNFVATTVRSHDFAGKIKFDRLAVPIGQEKSCRFDAVSAGLNKANAPLQSHFRALHGVGRLVIDGR
jgi:hypothetical protein